MNTSRGLIKSMKRDWLQTGRHPSGICGAALYIACAMHGVDKTKENIIAVVKIGEGTLEKRVIEFAHSDAGDLTLRDLEDILETHEREKVRSFSACCSPTTRTLPLSACCEGLYLLKQHARGVSWLRVAPAAGLRVVRMQVLGEGNCTLQMQASCPC